MDNILMFNRFNIKLFRNLILLFGVFFLSGILVPLRAQNAWILTESFSDSTAPEWKEATPGFLSNESNNFTNGEVKKSPEDNELRVLFNLSTPVIADINKTGFKDQVVIFTAENFLEKFVDAQHSLVMIKVVSLPLNGTLKLNGVDIVADQEIPAANLDKITCTPVVGYTGITSFLWNASDGIQYAATSKNINLTIVDPGTKPVAVADIYTTTKGGTLTVGLPGVLINDTNADGRPFVAIKVTDPAHGSLVFNSNGSFIYVHNGDANTSDSFTYKTNNGFVDGNTVTVTISIPYVNAPPILSTISKIGVNANPITFKLADFVEKFTDIESLVNIKIVTLPATGELKLYGVSAIVNQVIGAADIKGLTFEPPRHWNGSTSFLWNGSDGTQYSVNNAAVNISVTQPSDPNAKIGLAKSLISTTPNLNGTYDLKYLFTAINYGPNDLIRISIKDNLALAFSGADFTVKSITATGNLKANTGFNGVSDTEMLIQSSSLVAAEQANVELLINVKLGMVGGTFQNSALAEAESPITGFTVDDISTNGLNPDPNGSGDVSLSEFTQVKLDLLPTYIPEGFSPNGDGVNDKFVVLNADGKQVFLEMYNRWGNRVYKSEDYKNDWGGEVTEGIFLGRDIPDGTYYYIITIDRTDKYAGFITVNR